VVVIYGGLIGWCQGNFGKYRGKLPPFCGSWILVIFVTYVVTAIAAFGVVVVAADLLIPLPLMLVSLQFSFLIIAVTFVPPYRF
jgi:hypothetical protein